MHEGELYVMRIGRLLIGNQLLCGPQLRVDVQLLKAIRDVVHWQRTVGLRPVNHRPSVEFHVWLAHKL
jgi:hypothetical protein